MLDLHGDALNETVLRAFGPMHCSGFSYYDGSLAFHQIFIH